MRVYIVEDEHISAEYLKLLVQELGHEVVGSSFKILDDIDNLRPDVVLLDVELGKISGFEILEKTEYKPLVIVTTAYPKYAIEAFEKNTELRIVDFVLKPISKERLKKAFEKCYAYSDKKIKITLSKEIIEFDLDDVLYIEAFGKNSLVCTTSGKVQINKPFKDMSSLFKKHGFKKIHRSFAINPAKVKKLEKRNFSWTVFMTNGEVLPISREYLKDIKNQFFSQE